MNRLRLSRQADADLDEIAEYIADRSPSAAQRQLETLYEKFILLAAHPLLGESCENLSPSLRAFTAGSYVIFYAPLDDGIEVARVIHASRDIDSLF